MSDDIEYKESQILAQYAAELFSAKVLQSACPDVPKISVDVVKVSDLSERNLDLCLQLLDHNLGAIYASVNGKSWKGLKQKEMLEPGLVYVLLHASNPQKLAGFMSMKIINEYDLRVLYLYEIQLSEAFRNIGMGTFLMRQLEGIVRMVNETDKLKKLWLKTDPEEYEGEHDPNLLLTGVALTVFSVNKGARKLYQRLGYMLHQDIAKDRVLRSGKVIEPDYYMLEKKLSSVP